LLAVLILMWMIFVPMAAVAGGEDDPGVTGMGGTESAMPPPEDEQSTEWLDWLLWLMTFRILP